MISKNKQQLRSCINLPAMHVVKAAQKNPAEKTHCDASSSLTLKHIIKEGGG
jgi:hypothetical protein